MYIHLNGIHNWRRNVTDYPTMYYFGITSHIILSMIADFIYSLIESQLRLPTNHTTFTFNQSKSTTQNSQFYPASIHLIQSKSYLQITEAVYCFSRLLNINWVPIRESGRIRPISQFRSRLNLSLISYTDKIVGNNLLSTDLRPLPTNWTRGRHFQMRAELREKWYLNQTG